MAKTEGNKYLVAIVGGGAAGMTAAIAAASAWHEHRRNLGRHPPNEDEPAPVVILEKMDRPGRKLLATGNGRCNLGNNLIDPDRYHGLDRRFARGALHRVNSDTTLAWFADIGLPCRIEPDGRIFPESLQAASVLDILRREILRLGIPVVTEYAVSVLQTKQNATDRHFILADDRGRDFFARSVVIATGGMAAPAFGCDGSGYELMRQLGHTVTQLYPSLVQVRTEQTWNKGLTGCKFNGQASIHARRVLRWEEGEILFTDYGLSGPPILQLSRLAAAGKQDNAPVTFVRLDFLPHWTATRLIDWFKRRQQHDPELELADFLVGLIPKKIGRALMKLAVGRSLGAPAMSLSATEKSRLAGLIKGADLAVTGTLGWDQAQVTAGGLATGQFSPASLESHLVKGLFAAGEVLDIDGDCGGFNLQWAWSSGSIAGSEAMAFALKP